MPQTLVLYTIVPTKSDSDITFCLNLLSQILTFTTHLRYHESIDSPADKFNTQVIYRSGVPDSLVNKT